MGVGGVCVCVHMLLVAVVSMFYVLNELFTFSCYFIYSILLSFICCCCCCLVLVAEAAVFCLNIWEM